MDTRSYVVASASMFGPAAPAHAVRPLPGWPTHPRPLATPPAASRPAAVPAAPPGASGLASLRR